MGDKNQILIEAIRKLAVAGEQAGFSIEEMIELLKAGVSVMTLVDLVCCRLESLTAPTTSLKGWRYGVQ